jgi:hypothetical protein
MFITRMSAGRISNLPKNAPALCGGGGVEMKNKKSLTFRKENDEEYTVCDKNGYLMGSIGIKHDRAYYFSELEFLAYTAPELREIAAKLDELNEKIKEQK